RERAASLPARPAGERTHAPLLGATRAGEATTCYFEAIARGPHETDDDAATWRAPEEPSAAARIARYQPAIERLAAGAACDRIDVAALGSPAWTDANGNGKQLGQLVAFTIRHELAQRRQD